MLELSRNNDMVREWTDFDPKLVRDRFDRLAPYYLLLYPMLGMPPTGRSRAIDMMDLAAGHRVLELGCGTGRNFPLLEGAVGPEGRIYGVDFSSGMLDEAHRLCVKRKWRNVTLVKEDATTYTVPDMINSVLFSLCYGTMANRVEALAHGWRFLKRGGNLVVFDGRIPESMIGRAINGYARWVSRKTVLANPYTRPWDDLRQVASDISDIEIRYLQLGTYYIFRARKS